MKIPPSIKRFVDRFSELPGVGPRQAIRIAFHLIYKGEGERKEMEHSLRDLESVNICAQCFYIFEGEGPICEICSDKKRNQSVIAVLEKVTDLASMEATGKFNGRYLILGDLRKRGVLEADQKLKLENLKKWIKNSLPGAEAEEIVIAINPTSIGDLNASFIADELRGYAKKISRLGRGIPTGGEIEFADEDTLGSAIERRF